MKLCEHKDFDQAIIRASEHFSSEGLRPSVIEKDYYVTEALRIIAITAGLKVIFKGGTSLAKGWNLIQRFSEDIDIFLDPPNMSFATSDALFPPEALSAMLSEEYAKQCRALCYGPFPPWPELLKRLLEIRGLL